MNRGYIIPRLILVILLWSFFYFLFDSILKWAMVRGLENIFEARVEIGKVRTSFLNPSLDVYDLKVGDSNQEYKNLFEFEKLRFSLNGKQLLKKKIVIEESYVKALKFATPRKTSCKIHISKTEMPEFMKEYLSRARGYYRERIETIRSDAITEIKLDYKDLKSVKILNELTDRYEKDYKEAIAKADFSKYQEKINSISAHYEKIKQEKDPVKRVKEIGKLKKDIDSLSHEYKEDMKKVSSLIKDSSAFYKELNEARQEDLNKLMSMAQIPSLDRDRIAEMLLGEDIYNKISTGLMYSKKIMKYMPDNTKKKIFEQKVKRGRSVHFPELENYPTFLLKKASVDGILTPDTPIAYSGSIANLTNQPSIWTLPLTIEIKGRTEKSSLHFKTQFNFADSPVKSYTTLEYKGVSVGNKVFGSTTSFSLSLDKAIVDTTARLTTTGSNMEGALEAIFTQASINPHLSNIRQKILRDAIEKSFASVNSFSVNVFIKGNISSPSISIKTDLADIFNNAVKKSFGEEIQKAKKSLEEKLDLQIKNSKEQFEKIIKDNTHKLDSILKTNNSKIDLWKKELEEKLKKQTTQMLPKIRL